ncbi:hypothetical protein CKA32_005584 [Geitlerinema sp. FC II]|nr:hypothetical protein CKA32_005584 [Geitlerinema sp. FC II]
MFQSLEGIFGFFNRCDIICNPDNSLFQSLEGIFGFFNRFVCERRRQWRCFNP